MIHTSNETAIDKILFNIDNSIDDLEKNIDSIIIPQKINVTKYDKKEFPILTVTESDFQNLKLFDFQEKEENYFIFIICKIIFLIFNL